MKSTVRSTILSYFWIFLACALFGLSFDWFYAPNQISLAGMTGLGQLLNFWFPALPVGTAVILLNIPLFLLGWRLLGGKVLISSAIAMALSSLAVDLIAFFYTFSPIDPLLASVFGGVTLGLSLGMVFQQQATTGGTDLIARLLKLKFAWLPMGKLMMMVDMSVIVVVALVFQSLESALYGVIALYVSSLVMDKVLYGMDTSKVAYIISQSPDQVIRAIDRKLDRGVTILHGTGSFSGEEKDVLMCAFKQKQIVMLKQLVKEIDPNAFLIVCDAHDVLGEGFHSYHKNDI